VFNATFSNISAISWRPVLVVEEAGDNPRPWASNYRPLLVFIVTFSHFSSIQYSDYHTYLGETPT
jgi:hypothetical protein